MRTMVVLIAAGALALGACGGDDDDTSGPDGDVSTEEQPYVDAIAGQFRSGDDSEMQLLGEQADCVAPRWVDTIGVDTFEEHDVTPEDITDPDEDELTTLGLDEDQGNELYDAFEACDVDVPALLIDSLGTDDELDEETRSCLADALDGDLVRSLMVAVVTKGDAALTEDSDLSDDFTAAITGCAPTDG